MNTSITSWRHFLASLLSLILVVLSVLFTGIYYQNRYALEREIHTQAEALFNSITLTRQWNAQHGGIYVVKTPGMTSNPYLDTADITTEDGRTLTMKNPALMTREISELAEQSNAFAFRIVSQNPLNPKNRPDTFERQALGRFVDGEPAASVFLRDEQPPRFRFMAPLYVKPACLDCHRKQGYRLGDVRGGISITLDITNLERTLSTNRLILFGIYTLTSLLLVGMVRLIVVRFQNRLNSAQSQMEQLVITDELTGLSNRRYARQRLQSEATLALRQHSELCLLLLDLDHFKHINNNHGHDAGDEALRAVGQALVQTCRPADILTRYSGDQFLLLLPGRPASDGYFAAERFRRCIADLSLNLSTGQRVQLTASVGVACYPPTATDVTNVEEYLLQQAGIALSQAKKNGRNRSEGAGKADLT